MYLDTNGDGVHSAADGLRENGTPTTVDVWIRTHLNRDGSPALCNTDAATLLTINAYVLHLEAVGGSVTYSGFINRQGGPMSLPFGELNEDGVHYRNGFGGQSLLGPGIYRLATLTITGQTGTPGIRIVDQFPGSLEFTSFGTHCDGYAFDSTYKLDGPNTQAFQGAGDWFDADGTASGLTNTPPVLAPIGNKAGMVSVPVTFTATATDVDIPAQALSFALGPAPAGATIDASTGSFSWMPPTFGSFSATVIVRDDGSPALADVETFQITIPFVEPPPALDPIGSKTVDEGALLTFQVTATDPSVGSLTFVLEPGAPAGASIHPTAGVFQWIPTEAQGPWSYPVTITVSSSANGESDSETIQVSVGEQNLAPLLAQPGDMTVTEGATATQQLTASDPDIPAQTIFFTKVSGPSFALVSGAGLVTVSPRFTDSGTYTMGVRVTDGLLQGLASLQIVVLDAPITADAGGPYAGVTGSPVLFDGTGSSDPEGNPLTYHWNFGDGSEGMGAAPLHVYLAPGVFNAVLTVSVGDKSGSDEAIATIVQGLSLHVFATGGNQTVRLGSGKPETCVQLEPEGGAFGPSEVDLGSLRMTYAGSSISAIGGKTVIGSDRNRNGLDEITACFSKEDLRILFADLPGGQQTVDVFLEASHVSGASIVGSLALRVIQSGGGLALAVAPNPLNPSATATFTTSRAGPVTIRIFDLHGRLVRTLMDLASAPAGFHDVTIDGLDASGRRLASGIYFLSVVTTEGEARRAVTILK